MLTECRRRIRPAYPLLPFFHGAPFAYPGVLASKSQQLTVISLVSQIKVCDCVCDGDLMTIPSRFLSARNLLNITIISLKFTGWPESHLYLNATLQRW